MNKNTFGYLGLTDQDAVRSRRLHGTNAIKQESHNLYHAVTSLVKEPMVLLLAGACIIYFITGQTGDAIFMLCAITLTASISLYEDHRSRRAIEALQAVNEPECRVIRNETIVTLPIADVVVGDYLLAEEGAAVAADGVVIHSNDFSVSESILTGESLPVTKTASELNNSVYQGTSVTRGLAIIRVTAVGNGTELGKIGKSLANIAEEETPLQAQIRTFVRRMALVGLVFFIAVWLINFLKSNSILDSLLRSLSLAMSILPEEIPVAFTTFMALGAWRLAKLGIIVKRIGTIETLGSASVICVDKTGTITKNQMELQAVYTDRSGIIGLTSANSSDADDLIRIAMWASEPIAFDPMEIALHTAYGNAAHEDERAAYKLIHEYPLSGNPPFMTHIFENNTGHRIVAAKGAPEAIMEVCQIPEKEIENLKEVVNNMSSSGSRILGVALGSLEGDVFPNDQRKIDFQFQGFIAFYDPPKENMKSVIRSFYKAGIKVKVITGDHDKTAVAIAGQIGIEDSSKVITGQGLLKLDETATQKIVEENVVFARMFPEAKLKVLNALKKNGHVVAMTGDGVNDGPALKGAHIGIAMGKRGTQIAKEVASIVLSDDDLAKMVDAIAAGRKIYSNLKKAIQYIISIHIPLILMVFLPLVFNWVYPTIFTPVHLIFLEMVMGPTCSVVYENEPPETSMMERNPRPITQTFFVSRELGLSILQGLIISAGAVFVYMLSVENQYNEQLTRSMVFTTIVTANVFLTLMNRSTVKPVWVSIHYPNRLIPITISITLILTGVILYIGPAAEFFKVSPLSVHQLFVCLFTGFISTFWVEFVKLARRS